MEEETFDMYDSWSPDFWWIWSRRDVISRSLASLDLKKDCHILDLGSGTGLFHKVLSRFGRVTSLEYADKGIAHLKKKGISDVIQGDAQDIPFDDNSVDVVTCIDVMEHVPDDRALAKEAHRVLKKGGYFLITVPAFMFLWSDDDELVHHQRRYTLGSLERRFKKVFKIRLRSYRFFFIFFPTLLLFYIKKIRKSLMGKKYKLTNSLDKMPPKPINSVLRFIMGCENWFIEKGVRFPFGVNIIIVLEKR